MCEEIEQSKKLLENEENNNINCGETVVDFQEAIVETEITSKLFGEFEEKLKYLLSNGSDHIPYGDRPNIANFTHDKLMRLFDLLIPDWKYRNDKDSCYNLPEKSSSIEKLTHSSIPEEMFTLLKDQNKSIFHHAAYSILIQYYHELYKKEDSFEKYQFYFDELVSESEGINDDYKLYISLLMARLPYGIEKNKKLELLELREKLRAGYLPKFKDTFKKMIKEEKFNYGSFHEVSMKPLARFYYFIATRFNSDPELIYRLFPHVEENSSLVSSFHEQRNLWIFDIDSDFDKKFKEIHLLIICYRIIMRMTKSNRSNNCQVDSKIVVNFIHIYVILIRNQGLTERTLRPNDDFDDH